MSPAPQMNATVQHVEPLGTHGVLLQLHADGGPLHFVPGQFLNVGLQAESGEWLVRAYSVGSAPGQPLAEFVVATVREGALSPRLVALRPGQRAYVEPMPAGTFTLRDVPAGAPLLVVATGTGIAPFMSMARAGLWEGRNVTVVHGARTVDGLAYRDQWHRWPNVTYVPTVSRDPAFGGRRGRVQHILEDLQPQPGALHALLCGNPEMIEEVRAWLEARGFTKHRKRAPGNLHMEAYW